MEKLTIYQNKEPSEHPKYTIIKIPQYINKPKYTKFKNFLDNNIETVRFWPSCNNKDIGALEVNDNKVEINLSKCIGCMACFSTEKELNSLHMSTEKILSIIYPKDVIKKLKEDEIFNGSLFSFPHFPDRALNTFSNFTSTRETTHISLWASSIINFLCSDSNSRIGKEIEIMKTDNPRDGRLDICIDSDNNILIFEAKVNLDSLLTENRYRVQIPSYEKECLKFIKEYNFSHKKSKDLMIFLLIGGEESELLPESHPECSSISGNKSKRFYSDLIRHKIKFLSANVLLLMMLYSFQINKKVCIDKLLQDINTDGFIGLTTAGIIRNKNSTPVLEKISISTIKSFVKSFS